MKLFKKFVYVCLAVAASCTFSACDDDDYNYPTPQISGSYKIEAPAYAYEVTGDHNQNVSNRQEITSITEGDVWEFNNGNIKITRVDGSTESATYTMNGEQKVVITFANGVSTEGFDGSFRGIDYFYPVDAEGNEDRTNGPEMQQKWEGFGEVLYVKSNGKLYRVTIPGRRTYDKEKWDGVMRTSW